MRSGRAGDGVEIAGIEAIRVICGVGASLGARILHVLSKLLFFRFTSTLCILRSICLEPEDLRIQVHLLDREMEEQCLAPAVLDLVNQ